MESFQAGDLIEVSFEETPGETMLATVLRTLSDEEEGLSPEIEDYVAGWIEVSVAGSDAVRSITLGTDLRYSLDGRHVTLRKR